jgi:ABC-type transporter Mla subunit MlaD
MTDRETNYAKMARQLYRVLTDQRPQWEARNPAAVADFEQLNSYLQALDEVATRQGGQGSAEYTDVRDRAEHAAEEAAGRLVRGLRTLQSTVPNAAIAKAASYTPDQLDPLHGPDLLGALNEIAAAADGVRPLLANNGVTGEHVDALTAAIDLYTPLAELPSSTQSQGGQLSGTARELTKNLRGLVQRFDQLIDSLREEIPGLAERYDEARAADANYVPNTATGPRDGGDGSEGGVGPEVAGNATGPEPKPFQ